MLVKTEANNTNMMTCFVQSNAQEHGCSVWTGMDLFLYRMAGLQASRKRAHWSVHVIKQLAWMLLLIERAGACMCQGFACVESADTDGVLAA